MEEGTLDESSDNERPRGTQLDENQDPIYSLLVQELDTSKNIDLYKFKRYSQIWHVRDQNGCDKRDNFEYHQEKCRQPH